MKIKHIVFVLAISTLCVVSAGQLSADTDTNAGGGSNSNAGSGVSSNSSNSVTLQNPLGDITSFPDLIKSVLDAAFIIGFPVAVLFIVVAGFRFVIARGNPEKLRDAKRNLLYTIVGIGVFFGAWVIAQFIAATMRSLGVDI